MLTAGATTTIIRPQPGPQECFLRTNADVAIYGGAAGGGKSWALLLDALRYAALSPVPGFGAVIFRRTSPQLTQEGGLWDEAGKLYPLAGGTPKQTRLEFVWPEHKTKIRFGHMQYESDRFDWQGSQIALIGFDELTHFARAQVMYMFSRNRSLCGVRPRMRGTTNPDADHWAKGFLAPWVDDKWPEQDRATSGEIRYFIVEGDEIVWLPKGRRHPDDKSCTFIAARIYDNKILLATNPEYLKNLKALPLVERQRLLYGDWNIRPSGNIFKREWFGVIVAAPAHFERVVRFWDLAATEDSGDDDPDYTAGVKMGRVDGLYYVLDVQRDRLSPGGVEHLVKTTAALDGQSCAIYMEQEPGSSGKHTIATYRKILAGYTFHGIPSTGDKVVRAGPYSSQCEGRNVKILRALWNEPYINELVAFPTKGIHDDQVDGSSGAFLQLAGAGRVGGVAFDDEDGDEDEDDEDSQAEAWR